MAILRPGHMAETHKFEWPKEPPYDLLVKTIKPIMPSGYFEHVNVFADYDGGTNFQHLDMFVDEHGVRLNLERNEMATMIYRRAALIGRASVPKTDDPESLPAIYGPAILFSRRVWF